MDRRTTIKWVLVAAAGALAGPAGSHTPAKHHTPASKGYGTDPDLSQVHKPGDLWPLTLTEAQRKTARILCDLIIPADDVSPSASAVGVVDFIDEWISAPYEQHRTDRALILQGLTWLDTEAASRHAPKKPDGGPQGSSGSQGAQGAPGSRNPHPGAFAALPPGQQTAICDDICLLEKAQPSFVQAATFFARYRDLTAGGFYTTPQGRQDIRYVGNVPLPKFDGPPLEVLKKVGLA